jgi:hypothetical protein
MTIKYLICSALVICMSAAARGDIFVNGDTGSDTYDGAAMILIGASHGPVATLHRAIQIWKPGDRIVLHKTARPYREALVLVGVNGTAAQPVIVEGNGAVLQGLTITSPDQWTDNGNGLISMKWGPEWGFNVVADGKFAVKVPSVDGIKPGQSSGDWKNTKNPQHRGYYKLSPEQSLGKTRLEVSTGFCGVSIDDSSHVIVRNLTCQHFWDDGFNLQGNSQDIRFENIVGRWNGDQGISAHGRCDVTVLGGEFFGNDSGIVDTVVSRTRYVGINLHNNRSVGVWFQGGDHSITDSRIVDNPTGIFLEEGQSGTYPPGFNQDPDIDCCVALRNVLVRGGAYGLMLAYHSRVSVDHATIVGQPIGIILRSAGVKAHIANSIISATKKSIVGPGQYWGDYNCWANSASTVKTGEVMLSDWAPKQGMDTHSIFQDPELSGAGEVNANSAVIGKAYVDEKYYQDLQHDGMWTDSHPPVISRNMGFDGSRVPGYSNSETSPDGYGFGTMPPEY